MRHISKLMYSSLALAGTVFLPMSAFSADHNTYRAGQAYLKTGAANFEQCEQQCRGDAACRGWNFIRPNPRSASGICEFNARLAPPTQSPISVSGVINTKIDPLMSRAIPAGTNTVRVGTPTITKRVVAPQRQRPTTVRRQPVPSGRQALRPAAHTKPVQTRPNNLTPRIYGGAPAQPKAQQARPNSQPRIYGAPAAATPPMAPRPPRATAAPKEASLTPEQAYYREQYLAQKRAQEQALKRQNMQAPTRQMIQQGRPTQQQRPTRPMQARDQKQAARQMMPPRPPQQLQRPQQPQGPMTKTQTSPQAQAPQRPASLYGSLHDDLTTNMTAVPRPKTAPDNAADPDAPLATSRAVPTEVIEVAPIKPAMPSLAGG